MIGPNGAGKTTLVAQISGFVRPTSGSVYFDGADITALSPWQRSQVGLARSFQITNIFLDLSVEDNVALAVQAHAGHSFRMLRPARTLASLREPAQTILKRIGLFSRRHEQAARLSHGEKRQLELAMALVVEPKMLLLDEPLAGMGTEEAQRIIALLLQLKRERTILLIEHDIDAVFAVADEISVLVSGSIISTGTPVQIRSDPEVRKAYLGDS